MLESSNLNYLDEYLICGSVALRDDMYYLSSTHPDVSNKYTIDTHKEGEHISVSKVHLVCRVMTLCVADPIWECVVTRIHCDLTTDRKLNVDDTWVRHAHLEKCELEILLSAQRARRRPSDAI